MENYDITKQDLQAALDFWRGVLEDEGSEPNEGTIEKVLQLEKQIADLRKAEKRLSPKNNHKSKHQVVETPQKTETILFELDGDTIGCIIIIGLGLYFLFFRRQSSHTTKNQKLVPFHVIGNIEIGETANTIEPGRRIRKQ